MNEDFFKLILSYRDYYGRYHDHKEKMAWLAIAIYFPGFYFIVNNFSNLRLTSFLGYIILSISMLLYFWYLIWQFRRREISDIFAIACTNILTKCFDDNYMIETNPVKCRDCSWPAALIREIKENVIEKENSRFPLQRGRLEEFFIYLGLFIGTWIIVNTIINNNLLIIAIFLPSLLSVIYRFVYNKPFEKCSLGGD
jgi:hypothetical protein